MGTTETGRIVDVAGAGIEIAGEHPVASMLATELCARQDVPIVGRIEFTGTPLARAESARSVGSVSVDRTAMYFHFDRSGLDLEIPLPLQLDDFHVRVHVGTKPMPYGIPRPLFRWLEPSFLNPVDAQAYSALHLILESMVALHTSELAPIHAAAVGQPGRAIALTAAGGVGKTTTSMTMLNSGNWRFLADDIAMIGSDGSVHPYRRRPMVYAYNLRHNAWARKRFRDNARLSDRLQWSLTRPLHGPKRRRRLDPDQLYGPSIVGEAAPVALVAFMLRGGGGQVEVRDLATEALVDRSIAILQTEFTELWKRLAFVIAAGGPDLRAALVGRWTQCLGEGFNEIPRLVELRLPRALPEPREIVTVIEGCLPA